MIKIRKIIQRLVSPMLMIIWRFYSKKTIPYRYKNLTINILPTVFHPGYFFSTRMLLEFIENQALKGKTLWELGMGNGLISMVCAQKGSTVFASDINPEAVRGLKENILENHLSHLPIEVVLSDLYQNIPIQAFDYIIVNPPYYPKKPENMGQQAFYCGKDFEYFHRFFKGLAPFTHSETAVFMILSEDCRIDIIAEIGEKYEWKMKEVLRKKIMAEWNMIYKIQANRA